jgi:uncharacterized protein YgbK (DUF1537 family)
MYTLENKVGYFAMRSLTASSALLPTLMEARPIYLLGDDLTGASDAAASFLRAGHSVRVWFGSRALHSTAESVQAFNTDSRYLSSEQAGLAVSDAAAGLHNESNALFFKKIDSAGRGPLAAEVLAAHRVLGTDAILVAPSFPEAGRTVHDGVLYIQDAAGQDSQMPLAALFPPEVQPLIAVVTHPEQLVAARGAGRSIFLCDATTQADLEALVRASADLPPLLYAGSAGLARAIASLGAATHPPQPLPHSVRTLIVSGTSHPVTQLQLRRLPGTQPFAKVLQIRCEPGDEARIQNQFRQFDPQALILTGGDTALIAVRALASHSAILQGEFAPGIPWGTLQGGVADGRIVITKSGGFGTPTTLVDILATLSGQV